MIFYLVLSLFIFNNANAEEIETVKPDNQVIENVTDEKENSLSDFIYYDTFDGDYINDANASLKDNIKSNYELKSKEKVLNTIPKEAKQEVIKSMQEVSDILDNLEY